MPEDAFLVFACEVMSQYLGKEVGQISYKRLTGGCINEAFKLETSEGNYFLKHNRVDFEVQFEKEAKTLELLRNAHALKVPEVFQIGVHRQRSYLLTEFIQSGTPESNFWGNFGENLARLHHTISENCQFGLPFDNYIGELPQKNNYHKNWIDFFVENRLEVQAKLALNNQLITSDFLRQFQKIYKHLPNLLVEEPPSLIHGDLWSGNFLCSSDGKAALIDPAVYYGNREIELAFTQLFGGFASTFYESYQNTWPLQPGFKERVAIYNLYPLMVHVNLFGTSYLSGVKEVIRRYA